VNKVVYILEGHGRTVI